jgi:hypothetical protein
MSIRRTCDICWGRSRVAVRDNFEVIPITDGTNWNAALGPSYICVSIVSKLPDLLENPMSYQLSDIHGRVELPAESLVSWGSNLEALASPARFCS